MQEQKWYQRRNETPVSTLTASFFFGRFFLLDVFDNLHVCNVLLQDMSAQYKYILIWHLIVTTSHCYRTYITVTNNYLNSSAYMHITQYLHFTDNHINVTEYISMLQTQTSMLQAICYRQPSQYCNIQLWEQVWYIQSQSYSI